MPSRTTARLVMATLVISLVCACGGSAGNGHPAAPTPSGNSAGRALAHQVPGMTEIGARTETYSEADGQPLDMDLYLPPGRVSHPVVLLLHGVTPDASPKDYAGLVGWGQALAASGVAAAVINYRADESGAGHGDDDVDAAIQHLRRDDRIDMSRWGLLAFSAGGPYGVRCAAEAPAGLRAAAFFYARTEPVRGDGTAATSLTTLATTRPDLEIFAAFGELDAVPGIRASQRRLQGAMGAAGRGNVEIVVHPEAGHAFDTQPDEESSAIVRAGLEFFVERLGG